MANCKPVRIAGDDPRAWRCSECGFRDIDEAGHFPERIHRPCPAAQNLGALAGGAGTELKNLLASFGIEGGPECACARHAAYMDQRGPDWCEQHTDTILGWLRNSAKKAGIPFVSLAAKQAVKLAIRRARWKAAS